jgi:hypothetical protein
MSLLVVAWALCCLPAHGAAQVLRGVVIDAETRAPLPAVLVALLDRDGQEMLRYLVDADGVFLFPLPGPGEYSVRAERLGAETSTLDGITVQGDETVSVRIAMSARPITLAGIEVQGESRCELARDAGADVQLVWDEARKVLNTQSLTDAEVRYRYNLQRHTRELDPNSLAILNQTTQGIATSGQRPIVSLPADVLLEDGFVLQDSLGVRYLAPDADVLLSDGFLDTHCFALRSGGDDEEGLIGLEFRPQSIRSGITDIEGVLWLESESGHLQRLDFRYRNLPGAAGELDSDRVGGRVEFRGLDNGTWIVSSWRIRMPIINEERLAHLGNRRLRLSSIIEEGGRVVRASRSGTGRVAYSEQLETITGQVDLGPLSEGFGTVLVMGTGATAHPDAQGRFRIADVPPGRYRLAYVRSDMMGLDRTIQESEVEVTRDGPNVVTLRPRQREAVLAEICGVDAWTVGDAILVGDVLEPTSGIALSGAEILVEWQMVGSLNWNALAATERSVSTSTNELGAFRACGVPTDRQLRVSVRVGVDTYRQPPIGGSRASRPSPRTATVDSWWSPYPSGATRSRSNTWAGSRWRTRWSSRAPRWSG